MADVPDNGPYIYRPSGYPLPSGAPPRISPLNDAASEGVNFLGLLRSLWRRKLFISVVTLLCTLSAGFVISRMTPHYVAHALLLAGSGSEIRVPINGTVEQAKLPDPQAIATDVETLKSPSIAAEVARALQLYNLPEFNVAFASSGSESKLLWPPAWAQQWLEWLQTLIARHAAETPVTEVNETVARFLAKLQVEEKGTSRVIDIGFESQDPQLAATVVNTLVQQYISDNATMRSSSMKRTAEWLHDKIVELQKHVQDEETGVETFRTGAGLYGSTDGVPLILKQIEDAQQQLTAARGEEMQIENRLKIARSTGAALANPASATVIATLDAQMATLEQQLAEQATTLGANHPKIAALRAEIAKLQSRIKTEQSAGLADIQGQLDLARMKEKEISARLDGLRKSMSQTDAAQITLRKLERDAEADRVVLTNFISRYNEATLESDRMAESPDIELLSSAAVPSVPERPRKVLLIIICSALAFLGSCGVALFREKLSPHFRSLEELESETGVKPLGFLPLAKAVRLSPLWGTRYASSYREAVRGIYANLFLLHGERCKTVVVTSAFPGEGKTTLALSLAATAALSGHKTALVDADFFRAGASCALGLQRDRGIADVLDQRISLNEALISDTTSGIDIITPGRFSRNAGLANVEKFSDLVVNALRQRGYELIIIDSPPLFAVSEALVLAAQADATVIAVRWAQTAKNAVQLMIKRLRESGAVVGGFVMTMVDERRHARYGDACGLAETAYLAKENIAYHSQAQRSPTSSLSRMPRRIGNRIGLWMLRIATMELMAPPRVTRKASGNRSDPSTQPAQALLVINMQDQFIDSSGLYMLPHSTTDRLIQVVNQAAATAKTSGTLIVSIQTDLHKAITTIPARLALGHSLSRASESLDPELSRRLFTTRFADAFSNPELDDFLRCRNVKHLFIAGLDGMLSVNRTARSALKRNYQVTFIRDGIATVSEQAWQKTLTQYEADAAFAISSQEFAEIFSYAEPPAIPAGARQIRS